MKHIALFAALTAAVMIGVSLFRQDDSKARNRSAERDPADDELFELKEHFKSLDAVAVNG